MKIGIKRVKYYCVMSIYARHNWHKLIYDVDWQNAGILAIPYLITPCTGRYDFPGPGPPPSTYLSKF